MNGRVCNEKLSITINQEFFQVVLKQKTDRKFVIAKFLTAIYSDYKKLISNTSLSDYCPSCSDDKSFTVGMKGSSVNQSNKTHL